MRPLKQLLATAKHIRAIGFDDAPFARLRGSPVAIAGVVCSDTRMEGMLWGSVSRDGTNATERLGRLLTESKFHAQVNLVLLDGIAVGGFNLIDLPLLATELARPCIAVMRRPPDLAAIDAALRHFDDYPQRCRLLQRAGPIYHHGPRWFQVYGCAPATAAAALARLTDTGHWPEPLRLAHLIGAAVLTGQSGRRA